MPLRLRAAVQVSLKKNGLKKPPNGRADSFTFKFVYCVSSADRSNLIWFQEKKGVEIALRRAYAAADKSDFPNAYLSDEESLVMHFVVSYNAGNIPSQFIGGHQCPGMAWPPLEEHDANHRYVTGALQG